MTDNDDPYAGPFLSRRTGPEPTDIGSAYNIMPAACWAVLAVISIGITVVGLFMGAVHD